MKTIKDEIYNSLTIEEANIVNWITDRRLTRETLCKLTGLSDGGLRVLIGGIKNKGVYIHSTSLEPGYKIAATEKEKQDVDDYEYHLAMVYLKRISKRKGINLDQLILDIKE